MKKKNIDTESGCPGFGKWSDRKIATWCSKQIVQNYEY